MGEESDPGLIREQWKPKVVEGGCLLRQHIWNYNIEKGAPVPEMQHDKLDITAWPGWIGGYDKLTDFPNHLKLME